MLRSEEENHVQVISQCLSIAAMRGFISVSDMKKGLVFIHDIVEERDALRKTCIRQETALTQQSRGEGEDG
jgi:hypothetical protein